MTPFPMKNGDSLVTYRPNETHLPMPDGCALLGKNGRKYRQQRTLTQEQLTLEAQK
jgi:hypothetical protein